MENNELQNIWKNIDAEFLIEAVLEREEPERTNEYFLEGIISAFEKHRGMSPDLGGR